LLLNIADQLEKLSSIYQVNWLARRKILCLLGKYTRGYQDSTGRMLRGHYTKKLANDIDLQLLRSLLFALDQYQAPILLKHQVNPLVRSGSGVFDYLIPLPSVRLSYKLLKFTPIQASDRIKTFLAIEKSPLSP
jgi:hypothetical protein